MAELQSFITMKDGYFVEADTGKPWVPHGIAYQTWNRPLGVWQTHEQIDYDLNEMVKMGANSIRVDFVWKHVEEDGDNQFKWENYDYLVKAAEERGIRIFALIGYQWPPDWFPDEWYTMHPPEVDSEGIEHTNRWQSDIINYEHPEARAQYAEWFSYVCARYKDSKAIVGWIIGNESGYLGLWSGLLDGYDPESEAAFRTWCQNKYTTISNVNARWGSGYTNFSDIVFVDQYRAYGVEGAEWADMVQWREDSIASFTAVGAVAAKAADTNHLISYSTVGMQWGEEDWRYHAEDRGKITAACLASNAPVDFFSVNNYPWSVLGHESQNGQWGISYTKKVAKVPVLYSETGFTSSETMWPGMNEDRQGPLIRNSLWESLEAGAIGTHIFAWHDRPYITDREKGFGVLYANRAIKPAFWVSRNTFNLMDQVDIHDMLMGSQDPKPDIAFLWTAANDSQYNRYECEMQQVAGALERLGYEPYFMDLNDLAGGVYTNYKLIILPRNMRVEREVPGTGKGVLEFLRTEVLPKGVNIMATADLPGLQDENGQPIADAADQLDELFGIDAGDIGGYEAPQRRNHYISWYWEMIEVDFTSNAVGPVAGNYHYWPYVWKYSDEIKVTDGQLWATMNTLRNKGFEDSDTSVARWDGTWGNVYVQSGWGWAFDGDNMVQMYGDSGMYKNFPVVPFGRYTASAWLRSNSDDALRNGKEAHVEIEWRDESDNVISTSKSELLTNATPGNTWVEYKIDALAPSNAWTGRRIIRVQGSGDGSVYVDNYQRAPAVVVKNHGAAKSAIFLYSAGDMRPDGDLDTKPDVYDWFWRYDVFGSVVRDYFGIQPKVQVQGTNAYLCLPEYRTMTNGATLWQVKNYMFDTNYSYGGPDQTFTITSPLFTGKTVKALSQSKIIEQNCDGTISLTLEPDGMEMLHVYTAVSTQMLCQIADAPAVVHPFGDKVYVVTVNYDTLGQEGTLKLVFSGGGYSNVIYQSLSTNVTGSGQQTFYVWFPDPDMGDTNYISTADGGTYQFEAWIEVDSNCVSDVTEQTTQLKWGIQPVEALPTNIVKGASYNVPLEWEELYEYLSWQNTPMTRNDAFPARVAIFRSMKTEQRHPGHLDRVNQVCDWLESMEYSPGNPLDISFDNVTVTLNTETNGESGPQVVFSDTMEDGTNGWSVSGLWHLADDQFSSASHSWAYNNGANYNTGARNSGSIITPWIALTNAAGATLSFKSWYETEDTGTSWDRKIVYITTDGVNWSTLLQVSGANRQWTTQIQDLSAYAGQNIRLKFFFDTMDAIYNNYKGWYVDNLTVTKLNATTVELFSDSMESTTNWTGEGLWHLATNRYASATTSWAYNNGTNYNTGARNSGSLVSRWIDLADASSSVTLTFRSWFRTEDVGTSWDRKWVYASADGTNWSPLLQIYGVAGQWTVQTLDLSSYAGGQVKLRFFFDTIDAVANNYEGWYIDDVRMTTLSGAGAGVFNDAMESGTNGWTAQGLWHQATDLSASASHSWAYNNGVNYSTSLLRNYGGLVSPWIDLTSAGSATLTFKSWYETEDTSTSWDKKLVQVSLDGTNWTPLLQISGQDKQWVSKSCDLSAYAGYRIQLRFFFDTVDGIFNYYRGWYIDDVSVKMVGTSLLFFDSFTGSSPGPDWSWVAGAANWDVEDTALRAWRIGNDDNILCAGSGSWSNYTLSADIRYNKQDEYFNDAELYLRYQDRNNFIKVGIRNYYGFWRLKYTVRANTNNYAQGWIYEFSKTNQPAENTWYNLKIQAETNTFRVFFDDKEVGSFTETNFPTGRIALGCKASQLGIWEPQKGYFFIDDDEYSYYSANESDQVTVGTPLNLDWGYLSTFFPVLILPSTYVMSDIEVSNVVTWIGKGMYSLIATDGGVAREDETGATDLGRIEPLFGVAAELATLSNATQVTVTEPDHYVTHDYADNSQFAASGSASAWTTLDAGDALALVDNGLYSTPAMLVNTLTNDPYAPRKAFCFNFPVDTQGQLTNAFSLIAQRAFEWVQGQAHKVRVELKYTVDPSNPGMDLALKTWEFWALDCWGTNILDLVIPEDNIMTGDNLYWVIYTYPWDATNAWIAHDGFYTSANDTDFVPITLPGLGLQILGATDKAFAGRLWDVWAAWNTRGKSVTLDAGLKEDGDLQNEDNFNDGDYSGWSVLPTPNNQWSVTTNGTLRGTGQTSGGYSLLMRDGLEVAGKNITIEYDVKYDTSSEGSGLIYRGHILYMNPQGIWWSDDDPLTFTGNTSSNFSGLVTNADGSVSYIITGSISVYIGPPGLTTGVWHHVAVSIRDGDPYLKSDVLVDGLTVYSAEALPFTNWTSASVGFLSPYQTGACELDNFRVVDEEYSFYTQTVQGEAVPTNAAEPTFYLYVPDYDPEMWEYEGTTLGGKYEWYAHLRGEGVHSWLSAGVYFAPRLMVEDPVFPTLLTAGGEVQVPIEWELLPVVPAKLRLELVDPYTGVTHISQDYDITNASGTAYFHTTVPINTPSGANYLWAAFIYPPDSSNPSQDRIGLDDTFRFDSLGLPIEPETVIAAVSAETDGDQMVIYSDSGLAPDCDVYTWKGGTITDDGHYTGISVPEGLECYMISGSSWVGWGVFQLLAGSPYFIDMSAYSNGFIRFWLNSSRTLTVNVEDSTGAKGVKYVPSTSNVWQEITIPVSDFTGINLSRVYGLFEITATAASTFYVDNVRWVKGVYRVYRDEGIPSGSDIITWAGEEETTTFEGNYVDDEAPEGVKCFQTVGTSWAGWGVSITNGTVDLRNYSNGYLRFWAKSTTSLKVEMEGPTGTKGTEYIPSTSGAWQEFILPISDFSAVSLSQMVAPFLVTAEAGTTFCIDDVRWVRGTNIVYDSPKMMVYTESGIPPGTDVFVWWASQYWDHVSATINDGGLEDSTAGLFPDGAAWGIETAGSGATALCATAAAYAGSLGLRNKTGADGTAYKSTAYQEFTAYAGDIYEAEVYVRQPTDSEGTWVSGSSAYLQLQFLDAWRQVLTNVVSSTQVTADNQSWTLCSIPDTAAPEATRYVRLGFVVTKTGGSSGISVADFDNAVLRQANSFNGSFTEDGNTPEGTKCFRSYCVNWSGWGIFYTNSTVDLSAYSNGCLKFWLKSSGYTKIEVQSQSGSNTVTALGASYGPTTNASGTAVWELKTIPITNFAGVALNSIKSPFMATDPTFDRAYYIDYVRWELAP